MLITHATIYINDCLITEDIDLDITSKIVQPGPHLIVRTDIIILNCNLFDEFANNMSLINITFFSLHRTYYSSGYVLKDGNNAHFILAAGEWS